MYVVVHVDDVLCVVVGASLEEVYSGLKKIYNLKSTMVRGGNMRCGAAIV